MAVAEIFATDRGTYVSVTLLTIYWLKIAGREANFPTSIRW
jgi:hypothetical protein